MIKTFVDHESGKTTALIENCELDAIRIIMKRHQAIKCSYNDVGTVKYDIEHGADVFGLKKALLPNNVYASVTLQDGDTFDEEFGRRLARKKVVRKIRRMTKNAIKRWTKHYTANVEKAVLDPEKKILDS